MIEVCPCMNCTERFIACSDKCPKDARGEYGHKAWKEQYQAQQKHLEDNKSRWHTPWTAASERRVRQSLKFGAVDHRGGGDQ